MRSFAYSQDPDPDSSDEEATADEAEYAFTGFNIEFSEKIMLMPPTLQEVAKVKGSNGK